MSDLVKRLREYKKSELADRIEELERELAAHESREVIYKIQVEAGKKYMDKLAAEKALADNLWAVLGYFGALRNSYFEQSDIATAYRKARGL